MVSEVTEVSEPGLVVAVLLLLLLVVFLLLLQTAAAARIPPLHPLGCREENRKRTG